MFELLGGEGGEEERRCLLWEGPFVLGAVVFEDDDDSDMKNPDPINFAVNACAPFLTIKVCLESGIKNVAAYWALPNRRTRRSVEQTNFKLVEASKRLGDEEFHRRLRISLKLESRTKKS